MCDEVCLVVVVMMVLANRPSTRSLSISTAAITAAVRYYQSLSLFFFLFRLLLFSGWQAALLLLARLFHRLGLPLLKPKLGLRRIERKHQNTRYMFWRVRERERKRERKSTFSLSLSFLVVVIHRRRFRVLVCCMCVPAAVAVAVVAVAPAVSIWCRGAKNTHTPVKLPPQLALVAEELRERQFCSPNRITRKKWKSEAKRLPSVVSAVFSPVLLQRRRKRFFSMCVYVCPSILSAHCRALVAARW